MANYIKKEKDKKIFITNSAGLTDEEKAEIKLYVDLMGYTFDISRAKPKREPKKGYSKVEIIYYLEKKAPEDTVKEFITLADINYMKGFQWFKKWYKEQNKKEYAGEANDLITADGAKAESRIKELQAIEDKKKEDKKNKK